MGRREGRGWEGKTGRGKEGLNLLHGRLKTLTAHCIASTAFLYIVQLMSSS